MDMNEYYSTRFDFERTKGKLEAMRLSYVHLESQIKATEKQTDFLKKKIADYEKKILKGDI